MRPVLIVSVLALLVSGSAAAQPNPGVNGEIVFERNGTVSAFDPRSGKTRDIASGGQPAWSPLGGLAFVRGETIDVAAADGSNAQPVTNGSWPAWSPDGKQLAFVRSHDLYVVTVATGNVVQLTSGVDAVLPAWSPDGSTIAFGAGGGLFRVAADGTSAPQGLPLGVLVNGGASWSPDGSQLAFVGANGQVFVASADGSNARQLTFTLVTPSGALQRPAWSPDGGLVAWVQGSDLCVVDPGGKVARLTRTQQAPRVPPAALPDWQSTSWPAYRPVAAPPGANDATSCDATPGARVDVLPTNVSSQRVTLAAPKEIAFVNHLPVPVTVATTLRSRRGTIPPGGVFAFATSVGEYEFTVTGYPDGVPRRGTFAVESAGRASIDQHGAIPYGTRTTLTGVAAGPGGLRVTVTARPYGSRVTTRVATVAPTSGRWRVSVAPRVTTVYRVTYAGATAERPLRVMPTLHVGRSGSQVQVSLTPASQLRAKPVYLFRSAGRGWDQVRTARIDRAGHASYAGLAPGRYYVGFPGNDAYWATASEPFTIGR